VSIVDGNARWPIVVALVAVAIAIAAVTMRHRRDSHATSATPVASSSADEIDASAMPVRIVHTHQVANF
jgi:hypothetical protein